MADDISPQEMEKQKIDYGRTEEEENLQNKNESQHESTAEDLKAQELATQNNPLLASLVQMGFSFGKASQALAAVDNASIDAALHWLEVDINEEENNGDTRKEPSKAKLTPEEAAQKAYELQKRYRAEKKKREKEEELQKEKNRIQSSKALQEQQRKLEEASRKRDLEQVIREREENKKEKERQRELLKQEWIERFGTADNFPASNEEKLMQNPKNQILFHLNQLKHIAMKNDTSKSEVKVCMNTVNTYLKNVHDNVTEMKFRTINKTNAAFQSRVSKFDDAIKILELCGFKETEGDQKLVLPGEVPDLFLIGEELKYSGIILRQLS